MTGSSGLPRILVVSESCISSAHGTGTIVLRHFSGYPAASLANAHCHAAGTPGWANTFAYEVSRSRNAASFGTIVLRASNRIARAVGVPSLCAHQEIDFAPQRPGIDDEIERFQPQLVYSVAYSETGLALLDHVARLIDSRVPVIQYFMDLHLVPGFRGTRYLRRAVRRASETWALTPQIAEAISPYLRASRRAVRVQPGFHQPLPSRTWRPSDKQAHELRCVILGNFWNDAMPALVKRVWARVQAALPGVAPIAWYCHPDGVRRARENCGELEPEIRPSGFHQSAGLLERLLDADFALVPFNEHRHAENNYARYSLPSRMTELLGVGLPIFCIAGADTPVARYLAQDRLAMVRDAEQEEELAASLVEFMRSSELRAGFASRARQFAEREFDLASFQAWFHEHLREVALPPAACASGLGGSGEMPAPVAE